MATDRHEAAKRGQQRKPSNRHPYFALEWRLLDSEAYADLTFSARSLLDVLGRQLGVPAEKIAATIKRLGGNPAEYGL